MNNFSKKYNFINPIIKYYSKLEYNIGPHAKLIFKELISSIKNENWATVIILSATFLDVLNHEIDGVKIEIDGLTLNSTFSSRSIYWLRTRRNSIVHHEGPTEGMMGGKFEMEELKLDAKKSVQILEKLIKGLINFE